MFPSRVKYTESECDIQNNNLLYKIDQKPKVHLKNTKFSRKSKMLVFCSKFSISTWSAFYGDFYGYFVYLIYLYILYIYVWIFD